MKVSVIGAGNVGAKAVYYIAEKNIADIVMVDVVNGLAGSKALDFLHAAPLRGYEVRIRGTTDFAEIEGSDVVVITAGIARKPGMDRMDLLKTNVGIAAQAAREIALRAPNAVVIVVTNPLDVISMVGAAGDRIRPARRSWAWRACWIPRGSAGSSRRSSGVWPGDVQAMVLGRARRRDGPPDPLHLRRRDPAGPAPGRRGDRGAGEAHEHGRGGDRQPAEDGERFLRPRRVSGQDGGSGHQG